MRLIDADALLDSVKIQMLDEDYDITCVIPDIENAPTIEAEQVRHGRWIPQDYNKSNGFVTTSVYYFPKCSECGHSGESAFAFCPYCGAKMDGGGDNETD